MKAQRLVYPALLAMLAIPACKLRNDNASNVQSLQFLDGQAHDTGTGYVSWNCASRRFGSGSNVPPSWSSTPDKIRQWQAMSDSQRKVIMDSDWKAQDEYCEYLRVGTKCRYTTSMDDSEKQVGDAGFDQTKDEFHLHQKNANSLDAARSLVHDCLVDARLTEADGKPLDTGVVNHQYNNPKYLFAPDPSVPNNPKSYADCNAAAATAAAVAAASSIAAAAGASSAPAAATTGVTAVAAGSPTPPAGCTPNDKYEEETLGVPDRNSDPHICDEVRNLYKIRATSSFAINDLDGNADDHWSPLPLMKMGPVASQLPSGCTYDKKTDGTDDLRHISCAVPDGTPADVSCSELFGDRSP